MRALLCSLLIWLLWRANARAEDALILFEQPSLRPGLCAALRIQLTDLASVTCRPAQAGTPEERIAGASRSVTAEGARLAVLVEPDSDPQYVRMLVVGAAPDRALLAVEQVESRPEPDVDRALALKVRETLEMSLLAEKAGAARVPVVLSAAARRENFVVMELGGAVQWGERSRGAGILALGVRKERVASYGELALGGRLTSGTTARAAGGRVHEDEWTLGVSARVGLRRKRLAFGPALDVGVTRASAHGETADGRRGDASQAFLRLDLAVELRCMLWDGPAPVQLRFAPALELDPVAQRFALDGRTVLDLGRARVWLPLTLVVGLPLGGSW